MNNEKMQKDVGTDYMVDLFKSFRPENLKEVIILCGSYEQTFIQQQFGPNIISAHQLQTYSSVNGKRNLKFYGMKNPQATIADFGNTFLGETGGTEQMQYLINKLFILSFAQKVRIVFLFSDQNTQGGRDAIVRVIHRLSTVFGKNIKNRNQPQKNKLIDKFVQSIGFLITNPEPESNVQNYRTRFEEIPKAKAFEVDENHLIRNLFASVLKDKIFLLNKNSFNQIMNNIVALDFSEQKFKKTIVRSSISQNEDLFMNKLGDKIINQQLQILNEIKKALEANQLFLDQNKAMFHDKVLRILDSTKTNFEGNSDGLNNEKYGMITSLYIGEELANLLVKIPSVVENEKNYFSVFGEFIKIFGKFNFFCNENGVKQSKLFNAGVVLNYIHRMFESLESPEFIEANKTDIPGEIKNIVKKIAEYQANYFQMWYEETKKEVKPVNLINFYHSTIKGLEAITRGFDLIQNQKLMNLDDVDSYFTEVKSMLMNVKLEYYYKVSNNWLEREKVEFLIDLEKILYRYKKQCSEKTIFQGVKEIYGTLGNYCLKKKSYKYAILLYQAGMHFHQERKAILEWLETIVKRSNRGQEMGKQDLDQASDNIRRLTSFGFVDQAREWCYRFVEVCNQQDASQFLSLLSEILATKERVHETFLGEIDISSCQNLLKRPVMQQIQSSLKVPK